MTMDDWLPIHTLNGTKWVPTFISAGKCTGCPVYHECQRDVAHGDFAWCERVIPADYELTNSEHTAHAQPQIPRIVPRSQPGHTSPVTKHAYQPTEAP